ALDLGRVIYIAPGTSPTIEQFDIRQGALTGTNANGAGICIDQAAPTILNNNIYSNTATNGAAVYSFDSTPILNAGNRIYANDATNNGGALFVEASAAFTATIQNNFVYSNTAVNGGAFYNDSGDNLFWHNTIVGNDATTGGAVYVAADAPEIRGNLIISNTAAGTDGAFGAGGSSPFLSYNDFFGQTDDFGGTIGSGGVGSLAIDPDFADESYIISLDSPVVDMGDPTLPITEDFEADIRPSHQGIDIGADEIGGCSAYIESDPGTIYGSLQLAVDLAAAGETVYVDGTCYGVNTRQNSGAVDVTQNTFISKNLTIDGSWRSGSATLDALENGRVVYIDAGAVVTLTKMSLENGDAAGAGIGNIGGGVYNAGTLRLDEVEIRDNTAVSGGGIYNTAVITLENNTIDGNSATNGAGLYNNTGSGSATIINENLFQNNIATGGGGALYQNNGDLLLDGNNLFDNSADEGGALYLAGGTADAVDVQNNFIVRNTAAVGGGIYNSNTDANILHNTLYANTATGGSGGGIASQNNLLVVRNNIVDFNTGSGIDAPAGTDIDYNNVVHNTGGGYSGGAGIGASDIMTGPSYIDSGSDNYHLQDDSAGVDEADPASPVTTDFDGDLRPTNSGPDMGADEINSCLVRVIDPSDSSENLFGVLQDAINFAESFAGSFALPDVEIARGECRGVQFDAGLNTSQVGYVQENLRIIGSLQRSNFSDPDDLHNGTVDAVSTILNAEENGRVLVIAPGTAVTLTQVALVNGDASAGGGNGNGGAIHNPGAEMLLEETAVCQNQAVNGGGYYGGASATADITGVRIGFCVAAQVTERANGSVQSVKYFFFDGNSATGSGGGLYTENRFDIRNASFYGNTAVNNGGGLYNGGNNNRIINGTFYSNTATVDGGGIYDAGSGMALYHNTLLENLAEGGSGGAVWHNDSGFTMNSSIVYNNTSANTGGGLSSDLGTLSYNNFNSNTPNHTPGNVVGSNVIMSNPQLIGTLLSVDSPGIDMADPDLLITGAPGVLPFGDEIIDYDRQLDERPDGDPDHTGIHGKGADIGSDEYVKTFGCSITPPEDEATAVPGQTVTYNFAVLNSGNTTDTITITLQTTQGWGVLQNGDLHTVTLGMLESVNRIITVTIPTTATTGLDTSTIGCQSASKLSQTDSSPAYTTVGLVAGVIVTPDYNDTALPGDIITYTHQ
ncbi:MAG: right-handed parallel beta-helix repeat-containing protein, partial [Anaerolineales bacterium]|nr:right-handed parallel beta-helix repeat-containing protein [Anaerolineales bacterium]